jgi:hypothetical protein
MAGTSTPPSTGSTDGAAAQAQEKAQEVAGQAKEQAQQAAGQAKDQLRTQIDQRSTQAGEQVSEHADSLRKVSETLREQGQDKPAQLAEQAATKIEDVGSYLKNRDADTILSDVEDFARKQPVAVIAGGLALGFFASRFLKASQGDRYRARPQQLPNTPQRPQGTTTPALGGTGSDLSSGVGVGGTSGGGFTPGGDSRGPGGTPATAGTYGGQGTGAL